MRRLIWKIKNLWYWIPKLWNNYDFDSYYLMEVILHKLKRMKPAFENGYCEGSAETAKVIDNLIYLGEKIQADDYFDVYFYESLSEGDRSAYFKKMDFKRQNDIDAFFNILAIEFQGMWD